MRLAKFFSRAVLFGLICLAATSAKAQGTWFQQYNCTLTMPGAPLWTKPPVSSPGMKAIAQTTDRTASIFLIIIALPTPGMKLDARFIEQFDQGYYPAGKAKKTSGTQLVLQGVPAYKATGEMYINGRTMQTALYLWVADGRAYQLAAMKLNAPPLEDTEIQTAMNSFHFLNPPKL